jgi:1-phosphofructokinase family hexose kinase
VIYSALLNPAVDICYALPSLEPGQTYIDCELHLQAAGKGINTAKTVRKLGMESTILGIVPQDMRMFFQRYCDERGIDPHFLSTPGMSRINTTVLEKSQSRSTHMNALGSRVQPQLHQRFVEMVRGFVTPGDFWILTGSVPEGIEPRIYRDLAGIIQQNNAVAILDTRDEPLAQGIHAKPAVIAPNLSELEGFFREKIRGAHHIALKGKRLIDMGISYVFITLGSDGMIALHGNECLLCTVPPVDVVNTTGCGDALLGAAVAGMERRYDFRAMCRLACACGLSCAMSETTAQIDPDALESLKNKVDIVSV